MSAEPKKLHPLIPAQSSAVVPDDNIWLSASAGTGKTQTAKVAISQVRHILGRFSSVATVAHTGVAAANLGGGAVTIDSLFKLAGQRSEEDLTGEKLDIFVAQLRDAELLLIDEIRTVGPGQFEMRSDANLATCVTTRESTSAGVHDAWQAYGAWCPYHPEMLNSTEQSWQPGCDVAISPFCGTWASMPK